MRIWTHLGVADTDYAEATFVDVASIANVKVSARKPMQSRWPHPHLQLRMVGGKQAPDSFSCGAIEIGSARLVNIVRRFASEAEVELLPVQVVDSPEVPYWALNPIGFVDAVDRTKSEFSEEAGLIGRVSRLALRAEACEGRHLFAVDALEWIWVVSEELGCAIEREGIRGLAFVSADQWRPF